MSDRVAIIENAAAVRLPLVFSNHLRFDFAGSCDRADNRLFLKCQQRSNLLLQKSEEFLVGDNAVFDYFG